MCFEFHKVLYGFYKLYEFMPKITVEIIGKARTIKKKCKIRGNLIVLQKKTKNHPEKTASFTKDSLLDREVGLIRKKIRQKLMMFDGATHCIDFTEKRGKLTKAQASLDHDAIKHIFDAEAWHKAGQVHTKIDVPMSLYIMLFILAGLGIVNIIIGSGRVQIV